MTRRLALVLMLTLGLFVLPACDKGEGGGGDDKKGADGGGGEPAKGTIGYSAMQMKNPFFKVIADTLTESAEKAGYKVVVSDANDQVSEQANHIDNFIQQKVTAIVLNPVDRNAIGPAIKKANEAGIPVFTCDLQCVDPEAKVVAHVGTDNLGGGKLAGEAMIEALGEAGGDVIVVHHAQANSCVLRVQGFTEVIEAHNEGRDAGKTNIVATIDGKATRQPAYDAMSAALSSHPNLRGVFAINDPSALGAWKAIDEQKDKVGPIVIVGFDGQYDGKVAIKEGKIYADPIQFPRKMARMTVQNIVDHFDGKEVTAVELIPTKLYKKEDAEKDPELH